MDVKQQLAVEVFQLARRWRILLDARLKPVGLTKASWAVLYWLSRNREGLTQNALADCVGVETSTLTRQLDAMEAQSFVERASVDGDRRFRRVRLTEATMARSELIASITADVREELFAGISEADLRIALDVLRKAHARAKP